MACKSFEDLAPFSAITPVEVWPHTKNITLVVDITPGNGGDTVRALYHPEKGIRVQIDERIPLPYEVHHLYAYYLLSTVLGWDVAVPSMVYALRQDDRGALSLYYHQAETKPHYYYDALKPDNTWLQIAVLDYIAGLIDRNAGDILFLPDEKVVAVDNGLSFVAGSTFPYQMNVVRSALLGHPLSEAILSDVQKVTSDALAVIRPHVYNPVDALDSVLERASAILREKKVV